MARSDLPALTGRTQERVARGHPRFVFIVDKSASHHLSSTEIASDNPCRLNRSMQHSSNLLIRLCFSKRPDLSGCSQLNLDRAVFSLNQRSRTNLAVETPADWTSGRCCVDPLRPPLFSTSIWTRA